MILVSPLPLHLSLDGLSRAVRWGTLLYLSLPALVFAVGWLRPLCGLPLAVLLAAAVAKIGTQTAAVGERPGRRTPTVSVARIVIALVPVLLLATTSGPAGCGPRNWDWLKHDAILLDLIRQPWPVLYATDSGTTGLIYYVAYYLPAALLGKLGGWDVANAGLLLTTMTGSILAFLWLVIFGRGLIITSGLVLTLFSGMDVFGAVLHSPGSPDLHRIFSDYHLEWWAHRWQFSSNVSLISFVPQQALAGWLLTALTLESQQGGEGVDLPILLWIGLALLWSPFVAVGLIPLLGAACLMKYRNWRQAAVSQIGLSNLAGLAVVIVISAYFASRFVAFDLPAGFLPAGGGQGAFWFFPLRDQSWSLYGDYAVFTICEFLPLWMLLAYANGRRQRDRRPSLLLLAAGATLALLPWFHYGWYNDLVMRASIPALFVLQAETARTLGGGSSRPVRLVLIAMLACGATYSTNLLRLHLQWIEAAGYWCQTRPRALVPDLFTIQLRDSAAHSSDFLRQYLGSGDSAFFRYLAGTSSARKIGVPSLESAPSPGTH